MRCLMKIEHYKDSFSITLSSIPKKPSETSQKVQKTVDFLLMKSDDLSGVADKKLAQNILKQCDSHVQQEFSYALQNALLQLDFKRIDLKTELFISHVISLIPYCYPKLGMVFQIPIKTKRGDFALKTYTVSRVIDMSITSHLSPLKGYLLTSRHARPILIYTGTTFPAGDGFLNSLIADFTPFTSVGKLPFSIAKPVLESIFQDYSQLMVFGMSLGGALSLHTLRDYGHKLSSVFASVPAGLHSADSFKGSGPKVVIVTQEGDLVSSLGYFPEHQGVEFYNFHLEGKKEKPLSAHARVYSGSPRSKFHKLDPKQVNRSLFRRILTSLHLALSWLIFSFLAISASIYISKNYLVHMISK